MLIYPAIGILEGKCAFVPVAEDGTESCSSDDPVRMARLLRSENAKALHVVDIDGARTGAMRNLDMIRAMIAQLDIPMQVSGGIRDRATADALVGDAGVARIVLTTAALEDQPLLEALMETHGPRKIAVGVDLRERRLYVRGRSEAHALALDAYAMRLRDMGVQRLVVTNLDGLDQRCQSHVDILFGLAQASGCSVTARGYVWNRADLKRMESLSPRKIDSLILDASFYGTAFPCQRIWRMAEAEEARG
jgi:phosphoribosylformimino-5-aminoimidazole carboxamide ribotide isomerase